MCISEKLISIRTKLHRRILFYFIISLSSTEIVKAKCNFQCLACSYNTYQYQRYDSNTHKTSLDIIRSSSQSHENDIQKNIFYVRRIACQVAKNRMPVESRIGWQWRDWKFLLVTYHAQIHILIEISFLIKFLMQAKTFLMK